VELTSTELLAHGLYLASIVLFMVGIQRMTRVKTALAGNHLAMLGMALAIAGQLVQTGVAHPWTMLVGLAVGAAVGAWVSIRVKMTQMPEMVGLLNGLGGLASMIVGIATYAMWVRWIPPPSRHDPAAGPPTLAALRSGFEGFMLTLTVIVGAVTFTGSLVAFAKLAEKVLSGAPILLPARHALNLGGLGVVLVLAVLVTWVVGGTTAGWALLLAITVLSLALGVGLVIPIGGGDMPVVISLLNSYSGVAGALAGFTIGEPALVVAGSLVGTSGLILTQVMCKGMNRSLLNVVAGGFGTVAAAGKAEGYVNVKSADAEEAAMVLADARSVIFVPGYGMAVAQAQHAVRELGDALEERGATVRYAIHPVAGRMPGHMNVLLAEANIPYDRLYEMDAIDSDFKNTDVAVVIGANDVVNPAAKTDTSSPLYGMPVLSVEEARTTFVIKRSLGAGFAGTKNTLFERPNTRMIYMDARKACEELVKALRDA
jgi:NAD(P) transhydrogenase subunit beta